MDTNSFNASETTHQGTSDQTGHETTHQGTSVEPGSNGNSQQETPKADDVLDLNTVKKFRYGDQEWTPKDLQGSLLRQSDYTRKQQALAEARKTFEAEQRYWENLYDDLDALKSNPSLIAKFKEVYPEKFHAYLGKLGLKEQQATGTTNNQLDPGYVSKIVAQEIESFQRKQKAETEFNSTLDKTFSGLSTKYPYATENSVLAVGEYMARKAEENGEDFQPTSELWEKIWSQEHSRIENIVSSRKRDQYEQQKTANQAGRDSPAGGATPGRKPGFKTFEEATDAAIKALGGR